MSALPIKKSTRRSPKVRSEAATLRLAVFPRANFLTDVMIVTLGAALIALSAQIVFPLPFTPVPITGQTLAVLLVGASMGSVRGGAAALLYLVVGVIGAPIFADGGHGWEKIIGASGGFLIAFPITAALTGWLAERRWDRNLLTSTTAMLLGSAIIYTIGLVWLSATLGTGLQKTLTLGFYPFVIGDILKLLIAALLLPSAWQLVQRFSKN
jgi:biotin transport system substrate-specific component